MFLTCMSSISPPGSANSLFPFPFHQTLMWSLQCWTPKGKRCPNVRPPSAVASPTQPTKRHLSSRWRCSSCLRSPCRCRCTVGGAAWRGESGWVGSLWASTAPQRNKRSTGPRWRSQRDSRSASGTRCSIHRGAGKQCSTVFVHLKV